MAVDLTAKQEEQRVRLLEGLAESIREKGLAETQITDIVRHARASRRTFYKSFSDKDSCFVELAAAMARTVQEQVEQAIDPGAPLLEQVDAAIETYVEILMSDPAITKTFVSPALGKRIVLVQREGFERYANLVVSVVGAAAARDPEVTPISFDRAYMAITGIHQSIIRAFARGDDLTELTGELKAFMRLVVEAPAR
jgi:AcrR family transcriptional regulator